MDVDRYLFKSRGWTITVNSIVPWQLIYKNCFYNQILLLFWMQNFLWFNKPREDNLFFFLLWFIHNMYSHDERLLSWSQVKKYLLSQDKSRFGTTSHNLVLSSTVFHKKYINFTTMINELFKVVTKSKEHSKRDLDNYNNIIYNILVYML